MDKYKVHYTEYSIMTSQGSRAGSLQQLPLAMIVRWRVLVPTCTMLVCPLPTSSRRY